MLIAFLLAVIVGLTALNMYQDKVIEKQRYELQWLLTHSIIKMDGPPAQNGAQTPAPAGMKQDQKQAPEPAPVAAAVAPNPATKP